MVRSRISRKRRFARSRRPAGTRARLNVEVLEEKRLLATVWHDLNADGSGTIQDVTGGPIMVGQLDAAVTVNLQGAPDDARLDAWIDFNGDGSWGGPFEHIANSVGVADGDNLFEFDVPTWAADGETVARLRVSTAGDPGGGSGDGEVEDYVVTISPPAAARGVFGERKFVSSRVPYATSVFMADVDGDGDMDALGTHWSRGTVAWYENLGASGRLEAWPEHMISTDARDASSVFAADADGDGDLDAFSAVGELITWYENDGTPTDVDEWQEHVISENADTAAAVFAADVDGDGDMDVLSASWWDNNKIAWYENDGGDWTEHAIVEDIGGEMSVFAADVDADGDMDVLATSRWYDKIAWYENDGTPRERGYWTEHIISETADEAWSVFATDMDADGDMDVLAAARSDGEIAWYENDGMQNYTERVIPGTVTDPVSVFAADLDGDGDVDILAAGYFDQKIVSYENDGRQTFTERVVDAEVNDTFRPKKVFAADVDGDGDLDAVSASQMRDITWYENAPHVDTMTVSDLVPTASGFEAHFNRPVDPAGLNLYDVEAGVFGETDVTLVGDVVGSVTGSLVIGSDTVTFVATGGPLPPDTYTVTLRAAVTGFRDLETGELLDGDADGTSGGDFASRFTVDGGQPVVVSLPDVTRGPGQDVEGLALSLNEAGGVESIDVTIAYDPDLLTVTGATLGADMPADAFMAINIAATGQVTLSFWSTTGLPAGPAEFAVLAAKVPSSAPYGVAQVIDFTAMQINEGMLAATADDAIHVAAYFGDATGNGAYSGLDAQRVARVGVGLDGGLAAYPHIDPVIIADVTGNGELSGLDAQRIASVAVGLVPTEIPPLPQALRLDGVTRPTNSSGVLTESQLNPVAEAAVAHIESARQDAAAVLRDVTFEIVDLPGDLLGLTQGQTIQIDVDGGGHGWFVDATPWDDTEFSQPSRGGELTASRGSVAADRVDLLTAVLHELGHVLGYGHSGNSVMDESLALGTRRVWDDDSLLDDVFSLDSRLGGSQLTPTVVDDYFTMT